MRGASMPKKALRCPADQRACHCAPACKASWGRELPTGLIRPCLSPVCPLQIDSKVLTKARCLPGRPHPRAEWPGKRPQFDDVLCATNAVVCRRARQPRLSTIVGRCLCLPIALVAAMELIIVLRRCMTQGSAHLSELLQELQSAVCAGDDGKRERVGGEERDGTEHDA